MDNDDNFIQSFKFIYSEFMEIINQFVKILGSKFV